jgi:Tat protein secretion system quality control protein TatD with DNase activity
MPDIPALDMHCHPCHTGAAPIVPDAAVFAQTVSPKEWDEHSSDPLPSGGVWGLGLHPWWTFDDSAIDAFVERVPQSIAVGEIGLDGTGHAPRDARQQQDALARVLDAPGTSDRLVCLHSWGASEDLIELLADHHCPGAILHWHTSGGKTLERALELDVFYTVNDAMFADRGGQGRVLPDLPKHRVLTETDAPYIESGSGQGVMEGALFPWNEVPEDRIEDVARRARAGGVAAVELSLAALWSMEVEEVRIQLWRNLAELEGRVSFQPFDSAGILDRMKVT